MVSNLRIWSLGFTSIAIGALATLALCLCLARRDGPLRWALGLTCLSGICALATHGPFVLLVLRQAPGLQWPLGLRWPLIAVGESVVGLLWLSIVVLFEDAPITPLRLAPAALLAAVSLGSMTSGPNGGVFGGLATVINLALTVHVFSCVARGRQDDLIEKRRRLRRPLLFVLALALVLVLTVQIAEVAGIAGFARAMDFDLVYGALDLPIAAMALATAAVFLEPRAALLSGPSNRVAREHDDEADAAALAALERLMSEGEIWRREGLTVAALAAEVGVPEHRLRVLINHRLGHRNFSAFINSRRIDTASRLLADPAFADKSISKIAYDLGFASLGPFNRAFKDATGLTPTEWRRRP